MQGPEVGFEKRDIRGGVAFDVQLHGSVEREAEVEQQGQALLFKRVVEGHGGED